jgi:serine/threonine protein kinase
LRGSSIPDTLQGNEQMVYDELEMLQRMKHPHIVKFVDWFESRVSNNGSSLQDES